MKWRTGQSFKEIHFKSQWHLWFAWKPVMIGLDEDGKKIKAWLQMVERKGVLMGRPSDDWWEWFYRAIKLKE